MKKNSDKNVRIEPPERVKKSRTGIPTEPVRLIYWVYEYTFTAYERYREEQRRQEAERKQDKRIDFLAGE
jgi:hypothetical protein